MGLTMEDLGLKGADQRWIDAQVAVIGSMMIYIMRWIVCGRIVVSVISSTLATGM